MWIWDQLKQPGSLRSSVAILGGVTLGLASYFLVRALQFQHSVMDKGKPPSNGAPAFQILWHVQNAFVSAVKLPWVLLIFFYFIWLAVQERNKKNGWVAALAVGLFFVSILRQLIQRS
jgi:hypothetical protein